MGRPAGERGYSMRGGSVLKEGSDWSWGAPPARALFSIPRAIDIAPLLLQNRCVPDFTNRKTILVTGASGHVGREVCRHLRAAEKDVLAVDLSPDAQHHVLSCDLRVSSDISRLFKNHPLGGVIHLAGILPTAFRLDPIGGAAVNLTGTLDLIQQAVIAGVQRFVFASSMSVYGSSSASHTMNEDEPATPDDPYGAAKRAIELVGEALHNLQSIEFVSLRIARVVGPGIARTSSPWRSQIFEPASLTSSIRIPFSPEAILSLVHVEDVAQMLAVLAEAPVVRSCVYNTPVETWKAQHLKEIVEAVKGVKVELSDNGELGGPICTGQRFTQEFNFQLCGLEQRFEAMRQLRA